MIATYDPTLPELDIASMIAAVTAAGYKVSKPRPRKAVYNSLMPDGLPTPDTCVHCGDPAMRATNVGARKPRDRYAVGICEPCYRFGPLRSGLAMVPADPARAHRLYRVWRRAHNRWTRRYRVTASGYLTNSAARLADALKVAMTNQPMEHRNVERLTRAERETVTPHPWQEVPA